jgi:Flp pilus assembly protein TadG
MPRMDPRRQLRASLPGRKGSTTVEFALVLPVLMVLLFGIVEFGLIFKDVLAINQAAREGARAAAVGSTTTTVSNRVTSSAATLTTANLTITSSYRTYNNGVWSAWTSLANSGEVNAAPSGAQVRVAVSYPHNLVTGGLFSRIADPNSNRITLNTSMVMRRE